MLTSRCGATGGLRREGVRALTLCGCKGCFSSVPTFLPCFIEPILAPLGRCFQTTYVLRTLTLLGWHFLVTLIVCDVSRFLGIYLDRQCCRKLIGIDAAALMEARRAEVVCGHVVVGGIAIMETEDVKGQDESGM
jgi:hypothetical protein